jgi:hypothetical protein
LVHGLEGVAAFASTGVGFKLKVDCVDVGILRAMINHGTSAIDIDDDTDIEDEGEAIDEVVNAGALQLDVDAPLLHDVRVNALQHTWSRKAYIEDLDEVLHDFPHVHPS